MTQERPLIGVVFPQLEVGTDRAAIGDYIRAVESFGYDYLTMYDHVVGADPALHPGWEPRGPGRPFYTHVSAFHEPFALLGYAAGITERLGLATGVLVLGQRQTALVAKQAAEIDILSAGRFRLGVGAGWNDLEYAALGVDFGSRGRRMDEQLGLLRRLWTEDVVTFAGEWHDLRGVGLSPPPLTRPLPLWVGGESPVAVRRAVRYGDGFCTNVAVEGGGELRRLLDDCLAAARRTAADLGLEAIVRAIPTVGGIASAVDRWQRLGATHVAVDLMFLELRSVSAHVELLGRLAGALGRRGPRPDAADRA